MSRRWPCVAALVAVLLGLPCGCIREFIEVKVQPRPDGAFLRTLRLWKTDDEKKDQLLAPDKDALAHAATHYLERLEDEGAAARFQGTFYTMPADILYRGETNHGGYTVWRSPLGHAAYYRERRPGRLDARQRLAEAEDALDLLVKVGTTIARQQLEGEEGLNKLVAYLEGPLRRDLREAAFHLYALRFRPRGEGNKDGEKDFLGVAAVILQLFEERGHLKAADLVKLRDPAARVPFLMGLVAERMGRPLDEALAAKLALLGEPERAEAAFHQALEALGMTPEQFERDIEPFAECVLAFEIFPSHPTLRYALQLPEGAEVLHTPGRVDEKGRRVTWETSLTARPVGEMFWVLWAAPDAAWQREHLGRVTLQGQALADYIFWESGLDPVRAKTWRGALERLDPRQDLAAQLRAIRVTPAPVGAEPEPEEGATMILDTLEQEAPPRPPPPKE